MADNVNIGKFEEIILLLACETTTDDNGEKVETYHPVKRTLAHVEPATSESDASNNIYSGHSINVTLYRVPGMDTRWRIVWKGKGYNIKTIDPIERISPIERIYAEEVMR